MNIVSFNKIKELKNKVKETVTLDLGKFISGLDGIVVPIKVKTIEETLDLQDKFKFNKEKTSIVFKPFRQMPKAFQTFYKESEEYVAGKTETTYFQLLKVDEDMAKIKRKEFRQRLFNILIHLDMDYEVEEGKTYWEDAGLKKGDYMSLVDIFSDILIYDIHLDILDTLIDSIKSGITKEADLIAKIAWMQIQDQLNKLPEEERKEAMENLIKSITPKKEDKPEDNKGDINESKN